MPPNTKRKLTRSPSLSEETPKRRLNVFAIQQAKDKKARQTAAPEPPLPAIGPTREEVNNVSMRFSFTLPENSTFKRDRFRRAMFAKQAGLPRPSSPLAHSPDPVLNRSFESLSFNQEDQPFDDGETVADSESFHDAEVDSSPDNGSTALYPSLPTPRQIVPADQSVQRVSVGKTMVHNSFGKNNPAPSAGPRPSKQAVPTEQPSAVPTLSLPKKIRAGFGLSCSNSLLYDTNDYPDTEGESDSETVIAPERSFVLPTNDTFSFSSFDDAIVVRDIGSFHPARPQRLLACTTASREDTIRVKAAAQALLKHDESMEIYGKLVLRLERMVKASQQDTATDCARTLKDYMVRSEDGRIGTGELKTVVKHEGEWASWILEATRTGVMHVKGAGCRCRANWER